MVFISKKIKGLNIRYLLVSVVAITIAIVVGRDLTGGELHGGLDTLINFIKVSLGFPDGAESMAAEIAVHIQGSVEAVENDFPLRAVQGLSVDDVHVHKSYIYDFYDKGTNNL